MVMQTTGISTIELAEAQLEKISKLVKSMSGISLHDGKKELVKARLGKRLRKLGMNSFDQYIDHVSHDSSGMELTAMLDAISTNLTSFFRESEHFDYIASEVFTKLVASGQRRLRIWSAGCSTGEEPYSIAITATEKIPDLDRWDARVLATDLSTNVLRQAMDACYASKKLESMAPQLRQKHFIIEQNGRERNYRVAEHIRRITTFAHLNLMGTWPMRGPFDVIFCRNVMIYFDKPTRDKLVRRYWDLLAPGGTLLIGHSESLTGIQHKFKYVRPTIYKKQ
jgi:chemotaxis protein methyltransferase CheR